MSLIRIIDINNNHSSGFEHCMVFSFCRAMNRGLCHDAESVRLSINNNSNCLIVDISNWMLISTLLWINVNFACHMFQVTDSHEVLSCFVAFFLKTMYLSESKLTLALLMAFGSCGFKFDINFTVCVAKWSAVITDLWFIDFAIFLCFLFLIFRTCRKLPWRRCTIKLLNSYLSRVFFSIFSRQINLTQLCAGGVVSLVDFLGIRDIVRKVSFH